MGESPIRGRRLSSRLAGLLALLSASAFPSPSVLLAAQPAAEQPAEEQPAEEQPAEEQPAEEQPAEEHVLRGKVRGLNEREVATALVYARRPQGPPEIRITRPLADGSWRITGLGEGTWEVAALQSSTGIERVVRVELGGETAPGPPELVFAGATVLRGSVSGLPPLGRAVRVRVLPEDGERGGGVAVESALNTEGDFIFARLEKGAYTLEIVDDGFDRMAFQRALWARAADPSRPPLEILGLPWQGNVLLRETLVLETSQAIELALD